MKTVNIKVLAALSALLSWCLPLAAQTSTSAYRPGVTTEGAVYYLPKTALRVAIRVEKTTYTPGDFCMYAERYLRMGSASDKPSVSYRIIGTSIVAYGVADTKKAYAVKLNAKTSAPNITLSDEGVLLSVNATAKQPAPLPEKFRQAHRPDKVNPRQYLSQEILAAGSNAKMAELIASEIYDIRESKSELNRGEADYMPSDGEQLRIMLTNLDLQEAALISFFNGTVEKDTTETIITFCPDKEIDSMVLFRLSQRLGIVDNDDLGGSPVYLSVVDLKGVPEQEPVDELELEKRMEKANGIFVNVPGKIRASLRYGNAEIAVLETKAAQFGYVELLAGELFNKRFATHLSLDPVTGAVVKLDLEQPK